MVTEVRFASPAATVCFNVESHLFCHAERREGIPNRLKKKIDASTPAKSSRSRGARQKKKGAAHE